MCASVFSHWDTHIHNRTNNCAVRILLSHWHGPSKIHHHTLAHKMIRTDTHDWIMHFSVVLESWIFDIDASFVCNIFIYAKMMYFHGRFHFISFLMQSSNQVNIVFSWTALISSFTINQNFYNRMYTIWIVEIFMHLENLVS